MRYERTAPLTTTTARGGVCVADGYGIRILVHRGQLIVQDGIGRTRRERAFPRVRPGLNRLVVVGRAGTITFEAVRWLADLGIGYIHLDRDGKVLATSIPGDGDARLRRVQARAPFLPIGLELSRRILTLKVEGQRSVLDGLPCSTGLLDVVASSIEDLSSAETFAELVAAEREAALAYWRTWAQLEIRFARGDQARVPNHWLTFGHRVSPLTKGPRLAVNPANALLNYLYAILEAEARIACIAVGLDPTLGIVHVDFRNRDSFALDLMEAVRADVDRYVLELIRSRTFTRRDFIETPRGQCRVRAPLAHDLATTAPIWAQLIAPVAEGIARTLASEPDSRIEKLSTPLTRDNIHAARATRRRRPLPLSPRTGVAVERNCARCGGELPHRKRVYCDDCLPTFRREQLEVQTISRADAHRTDTLADRSHGGVSAQRRGSAIARRKREVKEWDKKFGKLTDLSAFEREILPQIQQVSLSRLVRATGLSLRYCSQIRRGERTPHPRHWEGFRRAAA